MNALVGGILIGWTVENCTDRESRTGGWSRSLSLAAVAHSRANRSQRCNDLRHSVPAFFRILGPKNERMQNPVATSAGVILIATMLLAFVVALALVFDPRYRDFPFAPLTAAVVPFVVHRFVVAQPKGTRPTAEIAGASRARAFGDLHSVQRRLR